MNTSSLRKKTERIEKILSKMYGSPAWKNREILLPLDEMIRTILSQNTSDKNSNRAFQNLKTKYPSSEALHRAEPEELAETIKEGGLGRIKAAYILGLLNWLNEKRRCLECDFICQMETDKAIALFKEVKGLGVKTIAVTLAFSCGRDIFPVDTHIFRTMRRLGLLPDVKNPEKAFYFLRDLIPKGKGFSMHMNVIRHGREICHSRNPSCTECLLKKECDYFKRIINSQNTI